MTDQEFEVRIATALLAAALIGDRDQVDALLRELTEHTSDRTAYGRIAGAWIDATFEGIGAAAESPVKLILSETGEDACGELPDDVVWSAGAVVARRGPNPAGWDAYMATMPDDDATARAYLARLLDTIARTLARHADTGAAGADTQGRAVSPGWAGRSAGARDAAGLN